MQLKSNLIIGFGISDKETFTTASAYSNGAIIGSAFINDLDKNGIENINRFVQGIIS